MGDQNTPDVVEFDKAFDPVWKLLKWTAVPLQETRQQHVSASSPSIPTQRREFVHRCYVGYCLLWISFLLGNFGRSFVIYSADFADVSVHLKLVITATFVDLVLFYPLLFRASGRWTGFAQSWLAVRHMSEQVIGRRSASYLNTKMKRKKVFLAAVAVAVLVSTIPEAVCLVLQAMWRGRMDQMGRVAPLSVVPFQFTDMSARLGLVVLGCLLGFHLLINLTSVLLVLLASFVMYKELVIYNRHLAQAASGKVGQADPVLNAHHWRLYHHKLCAMVHAADDVLSPQIGVTLVMGTISWLQCVYWVVVQGRATDSVVTACLVTVTCLYCLQTLVVWLCVIPLNEQTHKPADVLRGIDMYELDSKEVMQMVCLYVTYVLVPLLLGTNDLTESRFQLYNSAANNVTLK